MKCQHERCGLDWEYHGGMDHDFVPVAAPDKPDGAALEVLYAVLRKHATSSLRDMSEAIAREAYAAGRLAGAREMRERAADAAGLATSINEAVPGMVRAMLTGQAEWIADAIRALPLTPGDTHE